MSKPSLAPFTLGFLLGLNGSKVFILYLERTGRSKNWVMGKGGLRFQKNARFRRVKILLQLQWTLNKLTPQRNGSLGCVPLPQSPAQSETPHPLPSDPQSRVPSLGGRSRECGRKKGVGSKGKKGAGRQRKWGVRGRTNGGDAEKMGRGRETGGVAEKNGSEAEKRRWGEGETENGRNQKGNPT